MRAALAALFLLSSIALLPIPLRECPVCRGVAKRLQSRGVPPEQARTGCPSCRDRGRVPLLGSMSHPKVDPRLRALIQDPYDEMDWVQASYCSGLSALTQELGDEMIWMRSGRARFAGSPGDEFVIAFAEQNPHPIPGSRDVHCWLFDMSGNLLDTVACSLPGPGGAFGATLLQCPESGVAIRLHVSHGRFLYWKEGGKLMIRDDPRDGTCRLGIQDRRFCVLP